MSFQYSMKRRDAAWLRGAALLLTMAERSGRAGLQPRRIRDPNERGL